MLLRLRGTSDLGLATAAVTLSCALLFCGHPPPAPPAAHETPLAPPPSAVATKAAAPSPPHVPPPKPVAAPERPEKRSAFHYELHGRTFPLPLVHGSVGGTATWLIVDSGAATHTVAGWLARRVGLPLKKLDLASDHAGRAIATFRIAHPQVTIDGWGALPDVPMLATETPAVIEELGIGGFISPQGLVEGEGGAVVLDFPAGEMREAHYDEAIHALGHHGSAFAPNGGRVCEDDAKNPIPGRWFVVPASVEGRAVSLIVDTGAQWSDLLASSAAGKALAGRSVANKEQLYAAGGKMASRSVRGAAIVVGDFSARADLNLIPGSADPSCPRDGVVSMDVLKSCVLVLGKTALGGRCGAH